MHLPCHRCKLWTTKISLHCHFTQWLTLHFTQWVDSTANRGVNHCNVSVQYITKRREKERGGGGGRQTDRDRHRHRYTDIQRDKDRDRDRETERDRDRETGRERETETETEWDREKVCMCRWRGGGSHANVHYQNVWGERWTEPGANLGNYVAISRTPNGLSGTRWFTNLPGRDTCI